MTRAISIGWPSLIVPFSSGIPTDLCMTGQFGIIESTHVVALYAISRPYSVLIESGNCSFLTSIAERQNCLPLS